MFGWMGKIIRVNLTNETIAIEPLNMQDATMYIGGRGLGAKVYTNEVDPKADPLSPENTLVFMTGPLTGTLAACAVRFEIVTKSPLTGRIDACNSGGHFGPEIKYAGYDGIVLEGKSKKPVYLYIHDDQIELREAGHLWGKEVSAATDELVKETDEDAKIACIGPAGENQVLFSVIMSDKKQPAGRSGFGAVMGSKNLKAVAIRGSRSIKAAKPEDYLNTCMEARNLMKESPLTCAGLSTDGFEYEKSWHFGSDCSYNHPEMVSKASVLCGELGMDPIAMGTAVACAEELYKKGYVNREDIGMDLPFETVDNVQKLVIMTGFREGFGDKMALGSFGLAEYFGHPEISRFVKRQEMSVCGGQAILGVGLDYPDCHARSCWTVSDRFDVPSKMGLPDTVENAAELKEIQDLTAVVDSVGICLFTAVVYGLPEIAAMFRACTGYEYSDEEILQAGERIWNLERIYNLKIEHLENDGALPLTFTGKPDHLDDMLPEYYAVRGWNEEGVPTEAKKKELSIE